MSARMAPISVIIPCYRCSDTIERAVRSVEAQTLRPAEIILVDDASGDGTLDRLRALQARLGEDRVRIVQMDENGGPAAARNAGWEAATQPYIAFLDADDSWHSRKIGLQYEYMASRPEVAYTCHACVCVGESDAEPELPEVWEARRISRRWIMMGNPSPTPTVMLRRDIPFRFEHDLRYSEDYPLWMRIVLSGYPSYHLGMPLAILHKAQYGDAGLSGQLWKMERGELAAYARLERYGLIRPFVRVMLSAYSLLKYLRRVIVVARRAG